MKIEQTIAKLITTAVVKSYLSFCAYKIFNSINQQNFDFSYDSLNTPLQDHAFMQDRYIYTGDYAYTSDGYKSVYNVVQYLHTPTFGEVLVLDFAKYLGIKGIMNAMTVFIHSHENDCISSKKSIDLLPEEEVDTQLYYNVMLGIPEDDSFSSDAQNYINNVIDTVLPESAKIASKTIVSQVGGFILFDHTRFIENIIDSVPVIEDVFAHTLGNDMEGRNHIE